MKYFEKIIWFLLPFIGFTLYACNYKDEEAKQALIIGTCSLVFMVLIYLAIASWQADQAAEAAARMEQLNRELEQILNR
jgi:RsiW-degrading membrane proteinase PrsW (M82 family)